MAVQNNNNNTNINRQINDSLQLSDLYAMCIARWGWFVLSVIVCVGLATLYILRTPPVYTRSASVMVKEDAKGRSSFASELNSFADMGMFSGNTNVNNELKSMQSLSVITETVHRLGLDMSYEVDGTFHRKTLYGQTLPVTVDLSGLADNDFCSWKMSVNKHGGVRISDMELNGDEMDGLWEGKIGDSISTVAGKMIVKPTPHFSENVEDAMDIYVSRSGLVACVGACTARFTASLNQKEKNTVIEMSYEDVSPQRAEDFLNTVISVYNENWVKSKNQIAVSTSQFISERLAIIEQELGNVDNDISSFKSTHQIPDLDAAANMYMNKANQANAKVMDLNNELYMARYIRNYVKNDNSFQLLPANSGISNPVIEKQIDEYNAKVLERNSLVANSSERNPLVADLDKSLSAMRSSIITSIDNQINSLNNQIAAFRGEEIQSTARITSNPTQAKYLLRVERKQKVKEALYLFLLQKREETELSQAFSAYNTQIVNPPHGKLKPTSPQKPKILLMAFLAGLFLPVAVIYTKENMNTKVRGRKDLSQLTLPLIGEIPFYSSDKKKSLLGKHAPEHGQIVVSKGNRNNINEAFRVLRTNLEFMTEHEKGVLVVTSFNPGSGKSFISMNMATSLAIRSKKVLVIDGDLRHASASAYINSPAKGLSGYLNGSEESVEDLIVPVPGYDNFHMLPAGVIPPNPSELLLSPRLKEAIDKLKSMYDYVIIDCPPVEMVADTQILEKLADRTVFIIRAGLFERSMLAELESLYTEKKYKNMCLILNGTGTIGGRYGYRYGYHYGYGGEYYGNKKK